MVNEIPENIEELKKKANDKSNWRARLEAVNMLKEYDCQPSRDILARLAIHDNVWTVKEAAFRGAQALHVTYGGKPIKLNRKPKGDLIKGINEKLVKVRKTLPEEFTFEEFKTAFQAKCPIEYDTYEGDKGEGFDKWLANVIKNLPKSKS